VDKRVRL